jgi:hypothetical protein
MIFTNRQLKILVIKIVHWRTCSDQLGLIFLHKMVRTSVRDAREE